MDCHTTLTEIIDKLASTGIDDALRHLKADPLILCNASANDVVRMLRELEKMDRTARDKYISLVGSQCPRSARAAVLAYVGPSYAYSLF